MTLILGPVDAGFGSSQEVGRAAAAAMRAVETTAMRNDRTILKHID